jgi:RNA polymerase sigma factor (sigma-70 family)
MVPGPDRTRFEGLYREHCVELLRYAAARIDAQAAQEVVAECFVIAWRRCAEIPADRERAWLFAVAHRVLANERRAQLRQGRLLDRIDAHTPASSRSVADHADDAVEQEAVRRALARLHRVDREALQLTEWDGLSAAEAAQVLDCSVAAFRVRLHRARRRLSAAYQNESRPQPRDVLDVAPNLPVGGEA